MKFLHKYLLIIGFLIITPLHADDGKLRTYMEGLAEDILVVVKKNSLNNAEFTKQMTKILDINLEYDIMSQFVFGIYSRQLPKEDYAKAQEAFVRYVKSSIIKRFRTYNGETYKILEVATQKPGSFIVKTSFRDPGSQSDFAVDFKVIERNGQFKIFDVAIEDISMALTQRDEIGALLKRSGGKIDPLLQKLDEQIKKNELK